MPIFKAGDGSEETVLFVTLPLVTPDWFRIAFMGALREMTIESNWFVEGDSTAEFARDKAVEMINAIEFSEDNPLPVYTPPIGSIMAFPDDNIPDKWLPCHGQSVLRSDYADLFAVIGTRFGAADGTHFSLPNMQARFPAGAYHNVSGYELGDTGGLASVTLDITQIPEHSHTEHVQNSAGSAGSGWVQSTRTEQGTPRSTGLTGGGLSHENRPPYLALEFMIYAGV